MAPLSPDPRFPEYGSLVGSWLVRERIGSGSHGVVFRAVSADPSDAASYALKLALEPGDARFEREARLLSRLSHPSVPQLEGSGSWKSPQGEDYPYVVMQWVEGLSLYAWAAEHGLTLRQSIGQLAQVARALEATHQHGVHRDVKGDNVRVSPQGQAVLLDFGSCWYPGASPLTGRAIPPGTGPYRSPQQLFFDYAFELGAGQYYEAQSTDDVYALGITAYRLLAGVYPPRDSDSDDGSDRAVWLEAPRGLNDACPELSALILRMLSEDPQARGSAREVAEELERLLKLTRPALDQPWMGNPSQQPTEKTRTLAPLWYAMRELAPRWIPAGSVLLLLLWGLLMRNGDPRERAFAKPQRQQKATGSPDAGTSGLGEDAMASVAPAETPPSSQRGISHDLPDRPMRGQKRPPCTERGEVEINGGCWWTVGRGAEEPPCGTGKYEYQGRCYVPNLVSERVPTSEEPQ